MQNLIFVKILLYKDLKFIKTLTFIKDHISKLNIFVSSDTWLRDTTIHT
jgi:hypothetical protein